MHLTKKNFFISFLFVYFLVGAYFSLNTGLSFDEWVEQRNWEYNVALVKHILFDHELDSSFIDYGPKYYGIGFQIISQPIQILLSNAILNFQNIDSYASHILAKHLVVFSFYFVSGIFLYLIILKIVNNQFFGIFSTILYLLYPYLLGHGLFNPKDIPFLSIWVICTYISINIFTKLTQDSYLKYKDVILISFLSAFLLSIRVAGVLIFIQYLITFLIFLNSEKLSISSFLKSTYKKILFFILLTLIFTYFLYPVFWKNPFLLFEAINYMSKYPNDVCTLTLGKCMFSKNLSPTYVPIWLLVKLPVVVLIGLTLLPFTEKKIFVDKTKNITFGTLLITSFFIIFILIFSKVNLYDEIRQILFLVPIIFILGIVSLYIFSKKIFYFLSCITLFIFLVENVKIYPYQYTWFNTPSRILDLSKNFELDYWGISSRDLANKITKLNKQKTKKPCILVNPPWQIKSFLNTEHYSCFGLWGDIESDFQRPFFAVQNMRNLKKGKSYKCNSVYESKFNFLFSKEDIVTGRLLKCT